MAFLDNSGDIILDAVLTDEGRRRLAMGDGSFRITKFALGDDEVDYSLYTPLTASGYEDVRIFQLPVFESFTNNTTSLKNKLLTYRSANILHLPVIKLNSKISPVAAGSTAPVGGYYVTVDENTRSHIVTTIGYADAAASGGYRFPVTIDCQPQPNKMIRTVHFPLLRRFAHATNLVLNLLCRDLGQKQDVIQQRQHLTVRNDIRQK